MKFKTTFMQNEFLMITEVTKREEWNNILSEISDYDCYHTFEYHLISKLAGEVPILIYYRGTSGIIAFPLLKRKIPKSNFYDCTSVYGYAGPIFSSNIKSKDLKNFQNGLKEYCSKNNIISIFSRLNPYINNQEKTLSKLGDILVLGKVVYIDLFKNIDEQRTEYSKTTKRYLNKSRKFCSIKKNFDEKDILIFKDIYYENMNRVNANSYYFFDETYFLKFVRTKEFVSEVIYVILEETKEIIAGAILIKGKDVVHYHLSGTKTKYLPLNPLRLILDEARIGNSTSKNYQFFNLGGGLKNMDDGLFRFKSSFSNSKRVFKIWKYIANKEIYKTLVDIKETNSDFFPSYRRQGED